MTGSPAERTVLNTRPDTIAVVMQFRNLARIAVALFLLSPTVQTVIGSVVAGLRVPGMSADIRHLIPYAPGVLVLLNVLYRLAYQKTCSFTLTDERLIVRYGLLLRVEDEIELYRVVDVTQTTSILQRLMGVANIQVTSTDRTGLVVLPMVRNSSPIRNSIRNEAERCKGRRGSVRILE